MHTLLPLCATEGALHYAAQGKWEVSLVTYVTPIAVGRSALFLALAVAGDKVPPALRFQTLLPGWITHHRSGLVLDGDSALLCAPCASSSDPCLRFLFVSQRLPG